MHNSHWSWNHTFECACLNFDNTCPIRPLSSSCKRYTHTYSALEKLKRSATLSNFRFTLFNDLYTPSSFRKISSHFLDHFSSFSPFKWLLLPMKHRAISTSGKVFPYFTFPKFKPLYSFFDYWTGIQSSSFLVNKYSALETREEQSRIWDTLLLTTCWTYTFAKIMMNKFF